MSNSSPQDPTHQQANEISTDKRTPTILTSEWQKQLCDNARSAGFIALIHLAYILAADKQYTEGLIQRLWTGYQLGRRGSAKPDASTSQLRIGVWLALLNRWAYGSVAGVRGGLKSIRYIPLYTFNSETGELQVYDRKAIAGFAYVKLNELKEYFDSHKVPLPSLLYPGSTPTVAEVDHFVKNLRVEVVNDSEITIEEPEKSSIPYDCRQFEFKNERVKPWKLLLETLREKPHIIKLPPKKLPGGGYNKEYDRERKILTRLNEVLVNFFAKEFPILIPKGYKVYERYRADGPGAFILKFKAPGVILSGATNGFKAMPKEKLVEEIHSLCKKYRETKDGKMHDDISLKIAEASSVAKKKGWITEERVEELLTGPEDIEASIETIFEEAQKKPAPSTKSHHPCH